MLSQDQAALVNKFVVFLCSADGFRGFSGAFIMSGTKYEYLKKFLKPLNN